MLSFNEFCALNRGHTELSVVSCFCFVPPKRIKTLCPRQRVTVDDVNARKKKPKTELLRSHNHWHGKRAQWPLVDALPLCRSFHLLGSTGNLQCHKCFVDFWASRAEYTTTNGLVKKKTLQRCTACVPRLDSFHPFSKSAQSDPITCGLSTYVPPWHSCIFIAHFRSDRMTSVQYANKYVHIHLWTAKKKK